MDGTAGSRTAIIRMPFGISIASWAGDEPLAARCTGQLIHGPTHMGYIAPHSGQPVGIIRSGFGAFVPVGDKLSQAFRQ